MLTMVIPSTMRERRLEEHLAVLVPHMPVGGQTLVVFDLEDARDRADHVSELIDRHPEVEFVFSQRKGCWNATKVATSRTPTASMAELIALVIDPTAPETLYAGTGGFGLF